MNTNPTTDGPTDWPTENQNYYTPSETSEPLPDLDDPNDYQPCAVHGYDCEVATLHRKAGIGRDPAWQRWTSLGLNLVIILAGIVVAVMAVTNLISGEGAFWTEMGWLGIGLLCIISPVTDARRKHREREIADRSMHTYIDRGGRLG